MKTKATKPSELREEQERIRVTFPYTDLTTDFEVDYGNLRIYIRGAAPDPDINLEYGSISNGEVRRGRP